MSRLLPSCGMLLCSYSVFVVLYVKVNRANNTIFQFSSCVYIHEVKNREKCLRPSLQDLSRRFLSILQYTVEKKKERI